MASKAWNTVMEKTIQNCFKKCGFERQYQEGEERVEEDCVAVDTPPSGDETPEHGAKLQRSSTLKSSHSMSLLALTMIWLYVGAKRCRHHRFSFQRHG
ncbi:hypothetical protein WA026_012253 [Henosepilachna vigintioctopunctata]|uniref:Uncharacterized protein n=1 Tax=Henosepilachna vigintioctopunctata TaxID=420089 RepID=A0AAW1VEI1_9CUCU